MYTPAKITKKIGKESITFYFGIGAFHIFCKHRKIPLDKIQDEFKGDQMGFLAEILTAAANFNLLVKGQEEKYTHYKAFEWIDQMAEQDLTDIMETLSKVQILGKGVVGNQKRTAVKQGSRK